jgi:hypothetical protein
MKMISVSFRRTVQWRTSVDTVINLCFIEARNVCPFKWLYAFQKRPYIGVKTTFGFSRPHSCPAVGYRVCVAQMTCLKVLSIMTTSGRPHAALLRGSDATCKLWSEEKQACLLILDRFLQFFSSAWTRPHMKAFQARPSPSINSVIAIHRIFVNIFLAVIQTKSAASTFGL